MAKFALVLNHAPDRYTGLSEDDYRAVIKDFVQWVEQANRDGIYAGGHKLTSDPGRELRRTATGVDVHEAPYAELAEVLGGLMIIEAASYDDAVAVARTHRHLLHNTSLAIRQLDGED